MATYTRTYSNNTGGTGVTGNKCIEFTNNSDSVSNICPNIPNYSIINNVTIALEWKTSLGSSKGDCSIRLNSDPSDYFSDGGHKVGSTSNADNDYTWLTVDKNSPLTVTSTSLRLPDYFNSGKSNVGQYSGGRSICAWFYATVVRKFYWRNVTMKFDYTPPTYTIKLSSNNANYGTVSGGGTWDVSTTAFSKTITATPKTGYKFVKWTDSNGKTYNTNSLNITISETSISAQSTSVTYTATFEKTECTVTFRNQDGTTVKSITAQPGVTLGSLPSVSRSGYTFVGWIPCAPAIKTDNTVLDTQRYTGENNSFAALSKKYKYTNNLAVHIEAYMSDWSALSGTDKQIISCTDGGGWAIGMYAAGTEIHTGAYTSIDLGLTSLSSGWHSFDIVFTNGVFSAYVDGTKKGEKTTSSSTVNYNTNNTIFVGGEAGSNDSTVQAAALNFIGLISNVFIANQGSKLEKATENTVIAANIDYYPIWRLNPTYTITISSNEGGIVTGGGTYESGKTITLTAIPNDGYKFVSWSDGDTNASRTVTVTGNATYTATFAPDPYITYDSIFSFKKWKAKGISGNSATVSAITDTGFILTSANDAGEGTATSPYFPVEPGKSYTIDIDIDGDNWDIYVFFCDANGNWIDFADGPTNRFSYNTDWGNTFTAPNKDSVVKAQIRCDANGSNNAVSFSNFRIYPAEYDYMSNSVPANERTDTDSWSIPTPTREGYAFLGWFTEPIGGTQYNDNSAFPTTDLVLYSQWKLNKINQIYIGNQLISEIYIGTQPVKAVYIGTQKIYG